MFHAQGISFYLSAVCSRRSGTRALLIYNAIYIACNRQRNGRVSADTPSNSPELDECVRRRCAYVVRLHRNLPDIHRGTLHALPVVLQQQSHGHAAIHSRNGARTQRQWNE